MTQRQTSRSRVLKRAGVALAAAIAVSTVASTASAAKRPAANPTGGEVKVAIFDTFPGFCVGNNPANSSLMATRTMFETVFEKTIGGDYIGLLAESATADATLKVWTVKLRSGITFHDGALWNADSLIANMNAARGVNFAGVAATQGAAAAAAAYGHQNGTGVAFLANITKTTKVDDLTVTFNLDRAQNDFPGTLYASGRMIMRSPNQIKTASDCANKPVGTGPFKLVSWDTNNLVVAKNTNYWRKDPNTGASLPYLDKITFTNVKEGSQRAAAVRKGTYDAGQFSSGADAKFIQDLRKRKSILNEYKSPTEYYPSVWLNQGKPGSPFSNKNARLAVLSCIDSANYAKVRTRGEATVAKSLVGPKNPMYTTRGFAKFDAKASAAYVAAYKAETGKTSLDFSTVADTSSTSQNNMKFLMDQWKKCGMNPSLVVEEGAVVIAKALNAAPKVANGEYYNAYDLIVILLYEGTDVTFNLPFTVTNMFPSAGTCAGATSTTASTNALLAAVFRTSIGTVLGLNHHSDTCVDKYFYDGEASQTKAGALAQYQAGTAYLQTNGFMGSIVHFYYSLFTSKKLGGIGKLQIEKGKTQRIMTNWGIDWTGVWKKG